MKNALLNQNFLKQLYNETHRVTYIKVTSFAFSGAPMETLEGVVTGGSINLDRKSAIRRSLSVTMVANLDQTNIISRAQWSLETKIKVWIGLKNTIDIVNYPEIVYFPMGEYYLTSFNSNITNTSVTISLSGKDKMSLLNGDMGGTFTALTTDLGMCNILDDRGRLVNTEKRTIKQIIVDLVHTFGREPYHNIAINDIENNGMELLEYNGTEPLYIFKNINGECEHWTTNSKTKIALIDNPSVLIDIDDSTVVYELPSQLEGMSSAAPSQIYLSRDEQPVTSNIYTIIKITYGQTCGYRPTPLVYAGDLIMNQGSHVTEALDKIVNFLGPYEYFYNLDGQFVFQKKASALSLNSIELNKDGIGITYIKPFNEIDTNVYDLSSNELISSISSNILVQNIKNDLTVWGQCNNRNLHIRYAIDKKPCSYTNYDNETFSTTSDTGPYYNWREILYQMALDENQHGQKPDFRGKIIEHNPEYASGYTGYEQYYTDMLGFWRDLYDPHPEPYYVSIKYDDVINEAYSYEWVSLAQATETINREALYVYDKTNNELVRWVDTLDFTNLNLSNGTITNELDNMYYYIDNYPVKIIDSLDYVNNELYVALSAGNKVPYYTALTDDIQDCIYLGNSSGKGEKQKYRGYHSIITYANDTTMTITDKKNLYIQLNNTQADESVSKSNWHRIHEISIILYTVPNEVTLWSYDKDTEIDSTTLRILQEAIVNYSQSLVFYVQNIGRITYSSDHTLAVYGTLDPGKKTLWFMENESAEPTLLIDKVLGYTSTMQRNQYKQISKYDLYLKHKDTFYSSLECLNIDKSKIYWELSNSTSTTRNFEPVMNCVLISSGSVINITTTSPDQVTINTLLNGGKEYIITSAEVDIAQPCYIRTENKIVITSASDLYDLYYSGDNKRQEYFNIAKKNIYGASWTYDNNMSNKQKINWYQKQYDYFLSPDNIDYTACWNTLLYYDFSQAQFWIEFLDTDGTIDQFSVRNIGVRSKVEVNNQVTGIDFGKVPNILWVETYPALNEIQTGYSYILINKSMLDLFVVSAQGRSCLDVIGDWLSTSTSMAQTVSFNCVPMWGLDVGDLVALRANIYGVYEIDRITVPLQYNGTMSVSATKIIDNTIL